MQIKIVSTLYVDNKRFNIGDHIEVETNHNNVIEGELLSLFHDKIVVGKELELPYWVELTNIISIQ